MARLLGLELSVQAVETNVAEHSQAVVGFDARQVPPPAVEDGCRLVAQADGKGMPMVRRETLLHKVHRGKGDKTNRKKEAIAMAVYTIAP